VAGGLKSTHHHSSGGQEAAELWLSHLIVKGRRKMVGVAEFNSRSN
jgi:hypothetical protein